jgi:predicted Holliday junction resolvase-like endonuclease
MELLTEHNILSFIVIFLLVIVIAMQLQMSNLSNKIEEKEDDISGKIDELLMKKIKEALRNK